MSELESIESQIDNLNAQLKELRRKKCELSQSSFGAMVAEVFKLSDEIESIGWEQYTPYFNDGDTCEFSVHSDTESLIINDEHVWDFSYDDKERYARLEPALEKMSSILDKIGEETLLDMFEDHATITVFRNGKVSVDECSHD